MKTSRFVQRSTVARRLCAAVLVAPWCASAPAQSPDLTDRELMQTAVVVLAFDLLAQRCEARGGFNANDARSVAQWHNEHRVGLVRKHLQTLERSSSAARNQLSYARTQLEQQLASVGADKACPAAVAATRQPQSQFATTVPGLLAALASSADTATTRPKASPADKEVDAPAPARTAATHAAKVQAFGFDTCMRMGAGGVLWPTPCPVVLMRDGSALRDVQGLAHPAGLEAHRLANPDDWTQWRESGGRLQLLNARKVWQNLAYGTAYDKLPGDFRLEGRYQSSSGAGTAGVGGTATVAGWRLYEFSRDGRVSRSGGVGGRSEVAGGSTVTSHGAPALRGQYRIDGLTLHIQYDDGSTERRLIVADPKDPKTAIWLDGVGYSRRRD